MPNDRQLITEWIDSISRFEQARAELLASRIDSLDDPPWTSPEYADVYKGWRSGEANLGLTRGRLFHAMLLNRSSE